MSPFDHAPADAPSDLGPLRAATPEGWAAVALQSLDEFLLDHASCERKAAAQCMALLAKYPERTVLIDPLVALAREELEHFAQVCRILARRGLTPRYDEKDPYVNGLLEALRRDREERLLDRLIAFALIEARSHERLELAAAALAGIDPELARFYAQLARVEAGHHKVFMRLAEHLFGPRETATQLARLAAHEAKVMLRTPFRAAVH